MGNGERKLKILLVEDNPSDATWLEHMFEASRSYPVELISVTSMRGALEKLAGEPPHCVLLDLSLPDSQGIDSVRSVVEVDSQTPVVVLTGVDDEELGLEAVRSGAQDFLVKSAVSGDQILRHVLWAVARASVVASRRGGSLPVEWEGGLVAHLEPPAVAVDEEVRIVEANPAFEALTLAAGGVEGKALTDVVSVSAVFDVYSAVRSVAQGHVDVARLELPLDRPGGTRRLGAVALRLVDSPGLVARAVVVVDPIPETVG